MRRDEANHGGLLTELNRLSVRNLIKLDAKTFVHSEVNNVHPEQADGPFQMLTCLHSYNTKPVRNNNFFFPRGKIEFQKIMAFAGSKSLPNGIE